MIAVQFGSGNAAGRAVGLRMDLLWENDAPGSSFAAQTVTVDLSGYAQVMIVPIFSNSNQNPSPPVVAPVDDGTVLGLVVGSGTNNNVGSRTATIDLSAPGITFAGGRYGGNNNNAYCVPMWIYGIRTGSGSSSGSGGGGGGGGGAVTSVNGMTGAVILDAAAVSAVPAGEGVPAGGTSGQVLAKASNSDHDLTWTTAGGGSPELFWAVYGTTTSAEIEAAISAGQLPVVWTSNNMYVLSERTSATRHYFTTCLSAPSISGATARYVRCDNGTWTGGTSTLPPLTSPDFQGTPTAPTATSGTNSTQIATTAFVQTELSGKISAPSSPNVGDFLVYTSNGWAAQSLSTWQGGNY